MTSRYLQKSKFHLKLRTYATQAGGFLGDEGGYILDGEAVIRLALSGARNHTVVDVEVKLLDQDQWTLAGSLEEGNITSVIDISFWDMIRFRLVRSLSEEGRDLYISGFYSDRIPDENGKGLTLVEVVQTDEQIARDMNIEHLLKNLLKTQRITNQILAHMADLYLETDLGMLEE